MLKKFEPITFPRTMSPCFLSAATMLLASSGSEVPKGDHRQADHSVADTDPLRQTPRAFDQKVGTEERGVRYRRAP